MGLKEIVENNSYPIIFVGSGISKRYIKNSPSWEELLQEFWDQIYQNDFYTHLSKVKNTIKKSNSDSTDINFLTNITIADEIEEKYNQLYFDQKITIDGITSKEIYNQNISPFKFSMAKRLSKYELKDDIDKDEWEAFKVILTKAKIIVTTNYDTFIEDTMSELNHAPKIFVGQEGFFEQTSGWSELFKIHGSVNSPNSIVLNTKDYENYDKNSILISAKLISNMIESPILFLGYSLTDRNIKKLLSTFSSQLQNNDIRKNSDKFVVMEYKKDEKNIIETIHSKDSMSYLYIETDNFKEVYTTIGNINEGLSPFEVRKYNEAIKELIISEGQKGSLDKVLLAPSDIDNISDQIQNHKKIVMAIGNKQEIFINTNTLGYIKDYVTGKFSILPKNAIEFLATQQTTARFPMHKHYNNMNFDQVEFTKIELDRTKERFNNMDITTLLESIPKHDKVFKNSLNEIVNDQKLNQASKINQISYNAKNIQLDELTDYIRKDILILFENAYKEHDDSTSTFRTACRRLFSIWDCLKYAKKET